MASGANLASMAKNLSNTFQNIDKHAVDEQSMLLASRKMMSSLATPLVSQMGFTEKSTEAVSLLDSACGAGVFTQKVQTILPKDVLQVSSFVCADSSAGMVNLTKKRIDAEGWVNAEAKVLDAMDTGLPENSFSHVAVTLGLHIIPDPDAVLKDCRRVLKPGGIFGATTYTSSTSHRFWYPDMRSAFESLPFDAPCPDEIPMQMHKSGHWYDPAWIEQHLNEQGFKDVQVKVTPGGYHVDSASEFVATYGMMMPWLMNAFWSEEMRTAHPVEEVKGLIKKHLEEKYGGQGWDIDWEVISMTGMVQK